MVEQPTTRQLRLALSMNGGVSLAVWIAGAVAEIDRTRGDDRFWRELLAACGYSPAVQVDVLVGASAGGLNGVLMAQTIHTGRPFTDTLDLWHRRADLEHLVKGPKDALAEPRDPREILDGQYFRQAVSDVLTSLRAAQVGPAPTHDLSVFASATLVRPNAVRYRDVPGRPIDQTNSEAYFHVAKRGSAHLGLDGFVPGSGVVGNEEALAAIGRATSSLPGLFAPVPFEHARFGARLVGAFRRQASGGDAFRNQGREVEVMDGGVIDNVPIARAIRAIYQSRANGRVRRVLVYLHPDPGTPEPVTPERSRTAWAVVKAFSGKGGESIREDIDLLRAHNASVERRALEASALLDTLAGAVDAGVVGRSAAVDAADVVASADDDASSTAAEMVWLAVATATDAVSSPLGQAATVAMLMRVAVDPAAEMQWHAPDRPRVTALLDGPDDPNRPADIRRLLAAAVATSPDLVAAERGRRIGRALGLVMHQAQRASPELDLGRALSALDELMLLCDLCNAYQFARMLDGVAMRAAERLASAQVELERLLGAGAEPLPLAQLAGWDVPRVDPDEMPSVTPGGVDAVLAARIATAIGRLPTIAGDSPPERVLRQLTDGALAAEHVALVMLPLMIEPVASDQAIEFVRASGDVDTPASAAFMGDDPTATKARLGDRIAGRQLHHLGAFFQRAWRENDTRWGRLDAVPALVDALLDREAFDRLHSSASNVVPEAVLAEGVDATKQWLVRRRQGQLLTEFVADDPTSAARQEIVGAGDGGAVDGADAVDDPRVDGADADEFDRAVRSTGFAAWRTTDRRLASMLGTRGLTSTAMRGALTAVKVAGHELKRPGRVALHVLRPLLLMAGGVALAGRWATAAITWTVCVMAAPRADSATGGRLVCAGGVAAALTTAWIVERKLKPLPRRWLIPYGLALAGAAVGVAVVVRHPGWNDALPLLGRTWRWTLPVLAAVASSVALFFWMRARAAVVVTAATSAWYALVAYLSYRSDIGRPLLGWDWPWPVRTLWLAWAVAIVAMSWWLGTLSDDWLRPHPAPPPEPPPTFAVEPPADDPDAPTT